MFCLLNLKMAITIVVLITMIIMLNFHVAAAAITKQPDLLP